MGIKRSSDGDKLTESSGNVDIDALNAEVADKWHRIERGEMSYEEMIDPDHEMQLRAAFNQGYRPEIGDDGTVYLRRK